MKNSQLKPTHDDTYLIVYDEQDKDHGLYFEHILQRSQKQEFDGDIEGACNTRYQGFQQIVELIPEDQEVVLEWDDPTNQSAMLLISCSAIDHFLVGDFEMCAAMLELLLELDPEDHLEATKQLAYTYIALEEYELFDEIINDISDKYADKAVLKLWSEYRRKGIIDCGELTHFKKSFAVYFNEFIAAEHSVSDEYLKDVESEHPSREALARELWLQTEHLWELYPGFIEALRGAGTQK